MPDTIFKHFGQAEIDAFRPAMKIGLVASVTPNNLPHITLFSSLMACSPQEMCWGQFVEGISFDYIARNPKLGWLVMSLDKHVWSGKGTFTHTQKSGAEYDFYNNIPMFRYNAYFGIHTVHYLDLVSHSGKAQLPMGKVIIAAIKTLVVKTGIRKDKTQKGMNTWTRRLFDKIDNLKFLAYIDEDGYPVIIPIIQAQSADPINLIFATGVYTQTLKAIPKGSPMAIFGMCLDMTDVLVRGEYQGMHHFGPISYGKLKVDYVYNPMPPTPGQIFPPQEIKPVTVF